MSGVLALVLAIMMLLVSSVAFADSVSPYEETKPTDSITVTVNGNDHTSFKAVQIFKGTQAVDGNDDNPLGQIVWGDNITSELQSSIIAAVNTAMSTSLVAGTATAQDVAMAISALNLDYNADAAKDLAQALGVLLKNVNGTTLTAGGKNEVAPGYYLVIDMTDPLGDNDALNASLLQMTKDITIAKKTDAPKVDKKILENGNNKVDANTATIGDDISYEISSAVPDYTYYDHYYFIMNDTLSPGLTFNGDIKVYKSEPYAGDDESKKGTFLAEEPLTEDTDYHVYTEDIGTYSFRVAFEDVTDLPIGTKLFVRYSAKLNEEARIGSTGNPNTVTLTYSNNPDNSGRGDGTQVGIPDSTHSTQTGTTPEEKTITYTAEIDILKTKGDGTTPLAGAEFTLTGTSTKTVLKSKDVYTKSDSGEYYRLNAGTFTNVPPTGPAMTPAAAGATAGYVVDANYTNDDRIVIGTTVYRPYVAATDAEKSIFVYNAGNGASYASTTQKYAKTTATEITTQTYDVKMVATSAADGTLSFQRLGEGTYTIEETKVPAGYNKANNVTVVITADEPATVTTGTETATWSATGSSDGVTVRGTAVTDPETGETTGTVYTAGIYDTTIRNNSGATLPETGGIGTTIFYVAGSLMVLAAAILLITKRRMGAND